MLEHTFKSSKQRANRNIAEGSQKFGPPCCQKRQLEYRWLEREAKEPGLTRPLCLRRLCGQILKGKKPDSQKFIKRLSEFA